VERSVLRNGNRKPKLETINRKPETTNQDFDGLLKSNPDKGNAQPDARQTRVSGAYRLRLCTQPYYQFDLYCPAQERPDERGQSGWFGAYTGVDLRTDGIDLSDRPDFLGQRHIVGTRTTDVRFAYRLACAALDNSFWKTGRGIVVPFSHSFRIASVDCAYIFAGRRSPPRHRDRLLDNGGFRNHVLLDEFLLVNADSPRRSGATYKFDRGNLSGRRDACAGVVLFSSRRKLQQHSVANLYQHHVFTFAVESLCGHRIPDSRDSNSRQRVA